MPRVPANAMMLLAMILALCEGIVHGAPDLSRLPSPASHQVDFTKEVLPILQRACLECHGAEKQKGGYRLDQKQAAMKGGDNFAPNIIPGKSAESPIIQFVTATHVELRMPPKGDLLSPADVGILRGWIDQGAQWPDGFGAPAEDPLDWWSLKPIVRPEVPTLPDGQPVHPIDAFIRAKLAENGLEPAPPADRRTLMRRVYFDLIGLPPTPQEAAEFLNDTAPDAYERLIDRLLDSPRYGERWARHWLDVVHFGETHGYDKDQPRPNAWPYRDYVIRAFNTDKPYWRFVQEQIAGDVFWPETEDGITALGFIAAGPWDLIGHVEVPETKVDGKIARLLDRDDMVANTFNTFCSTSIQCARCHHHKFDPISQEDYYRTTAVYAALDRADRPYDRDPEIATRRATLEARHRSLKREADEIAAEIRKKGGEELAQVEERIQQARKWVSRNTRPEYGWHSEISKVQDAVKWVQVDLGEPAEIEKVIIAPCFDDFNNIGAGFGFPVRFKVELSDDPAFVENVVSVVDRTSEDVPNPGVRLQEIKASGEKARFVRVTATRLAPRMNDFIFALAEIEVFDTSGRNVALNAAVQVLDSIEAPVRWGRKNLTDGIYPARGRDDGQDNLTALQTRRSKILAKAMSDDVVQRQRDLLAELTGVEREIAALPTPHQVYAGTVHHGSGNFHGTGPDGGKPRPIFVLARGDVRQPGKEVGPGVPVLFQPDEQAHLEATLDEGRRRAALAKWITNRRNPLTWRSIVNRVWQYHFGRGLVDTPNEFGRMEEKPSHPGLLDWLAVEFRDGGQSLKKLHKLILTSATYQQVVVSNVRARQIDADNRLLWRMNRRKLEAEAIRDSMLYVAGRLDLTMGGPSFRDFVIEKPEHSPHYQYHLADVEDPQLHRRSIYRFLVRSKPQPFMAVLDCADPSMSVDKRNESVNALQALSLLNDRLAVSMARHFARRLERSASDTKGRVIAAFDLALNRQPSADELEALTAHATTHGLASMCRVILNLNEFAFVD